VKNCIGLFGTCDGSKWRAAFIDEYDERNIPWFNPDAGDNWHPGMVDDENRHLNQDSIILFPVLGQSLGTGSLGEIGFSVLNVVRNVSNGSNQSLIVLIDEECTDSRKTQDMRKESNRGRELVRTKMADINHPNIFLVDTLVQMKEISLRLWEIDKQRTELLKVVNR